MAGLVLGAEARATLAARMPARLNSEVGRTEYLLVQGLRRVPLVGEEAGMIDPRTGTYNTPFLQERVRLLLGYGRMQGVVFRPRGPRFEDRTPDEAVPRALSPGTRCGGNWPDVLAFHVKHGRW
jgi:hypothetical protein